MPVEKERPQRPPVRPSADDVRRRVVEAVSDAKSLTVPTGRADHAQIDLYLALLQDRLPVYVATMSSILCREGHRSVHDNLTSAAKATIDFYCAVLAAKVSVLASPAQLTQLRQVMRRRQLGPHQAEIAVARYLAKEQETGRVAPGVEPLAAARLLIGASLNYAFIWLLMGDEEVPAREDYAACVVRGLHLGPEPERAH